MCSHTMDEWISHLGWFTLPEWGTLLPPKQRDHGYSLWWPGVFPRWDFDFLIMSWPCAWHRVFFISCAHYNFEASVGVEACTYSDYFTSRIKCMTYCTTDQRMLEAQPPSPLIGLPSPFNTWLEAPYSVISKTPSHSHLRWILPIFSVCTSIVEGSARNLWGYMHCSFGVGVAYSNSPGQPYPLLLPTTSLRQANLMLTCV